MGNAIGAMKAAAIQIGINFDEYWAHVNAGRKWCTGCKTWHPRTEFPMDRTRGDGLATVCRQRRNTEARDSYISKPRPAAGRRFVDARDGDKKQARRRIDHLINVHLLPDPNDVLCVDCSHEWSSGERRHEYDHYLGYASRRCRSCVQ